MDSPAPSILTRMLGPIVALFSSAPAGAAAGLGAPGDMWSVRQQFPTQRSMAAMGMDPWVRACIVAKAGDLAGLPLYAGRDDGSTETILATRPGFDPKGRPLPFDAAAAAALQLLRNPGAGWTGRRYRRQTVADFLATGNSYTWWARTPPGAPGDLLIRLHPNSTAPRPNRVGVIRDWEWSDLDGQINYLAAGDVLHVADISWSDGRDQVLGESPIRALASTILAALKIKTMAAKQADRGRFEGFLFAKTGTTISKKQIDELKALYMESSRNGDPLFIFGDAFDWQSASPTQREMMSPELLDASRDEVAAVLGVPGTRIGLLSAAYGQARQEARSYWDNLRTGVAALFEDAWSQLQPSESIRIEHDFSGVEALQIATSERITQAQSLVEMGATPADALSYVGLPDAPSGVAAPVFKKPAAGGNVPVEAQDPSGPRAANSKPVEGWLRAIARRGERGPIDVELEADGLADILVDQGVRPSKARRLALVAAEEASTAVRQVTAEAAERNRAVSGLERLRAFSPAVAERILREAA